MAGYLVPIVRLAPALLAYLRDASRTTDELCAHFGYSASTIRTRLRGLECDNKVHHEKFHFKTGGGSYFVWHAGAGAKAERREAADGRPARAPLVVCRDPFDIAFFGPAPAPKQSAPVCTACKVEQGDQHLAGCIVPLVAA